MPTQIDPPHEQWLEGKGGLRIFTRHWPPARRPKAALTICHGVNAHGGQYLAAAETFAARGFAVTALDLRGRGRSEESGSTSSMSTTTSPTCRRRSSSPARMDPDVPLFLLGHSAGGVTAVSYACWLISERKRVFDDIAGWIEARLRSAPSRDATLPSVA